MGRSRSEVSERICKVIMDGQPRTVDQMLAKLGLPITPENLKVGSNTMTGLLKSDKVKVVGKGTKATERPGPPPSIFQLTAPVSQKRRSGQPVAHTHYLTDTRHNERGLLGPGPSSYSNYSL